MQTLQRSGKSFIIDDEDLERVLAFEKEHKRHWSINSIDAVFMVPSGIGIYLSRFLLYYNGELEVDHINRNRLDNRKENLRIVSRSINRLNSGLYKNNKTGQKGVYYSDSHRKWRAQISFNGKKKLIGSFDSLEEAINARKQAEVEYANKSN